MDNNSQRKLTVEEFRKINEESNRMMDLLEEKYGDIDESQFANEEEMANYFRNFPEMQTILQNTQKILSSDLSDIPSEEWKNAFLFSLDIVDGELSDYFDFSKTHANLDGAFLSSIGSSNFSGCNIENMDRIPNSILGSSIFDQSVIEANPNLFLSDLFDESFKKKYYNSELNFDDIVSLSDAQIEELEQKKRIRINHISIPTNYSEKFKLKDLIEIYYKYGLEMVKKIASYPGFSISDLVNPDNHVFFEKYMQNINDTKIVGLYKIAEKFGFEKFWDLLDKNYDILDALYNNSKYGLIGFEPVLLDNIERTFDVSLKEYLLRSYRWEILPEAISSRGYHFEDFKDYNQLLDERIIIKHDSWYYSVDYNLIDRDLLKKFIDFNQKYLKLDSDTINSIIKNIKPDLDLVAAFLPYIPSYYLEYVPSEAKLKHPDIFLSDAKPNNLNEQEWQDLKRKFYVSGLSVEDIVGHSNYRKALYGKNLVKKLNLYPGLIEDFYRLGLSNDDIFSLIDKYGTNLVSLPIKLSDIKEAKEIEETIENQMVEAIKGGHFYTELLKNTIGQKHPELFLSDTKPDYLSEQEWRDLKEKFYSKGLTLEFIQNTPSLLSAFSQTDIACGIRMPNMVGKIFGDKSEILESNEIKIKLSDIYSKLESPYLKKSFEEYIENSHVTKDKIPLIEDILNRIEFTNSPELKSFGAELASMVLNTDDPMQSFERIEKIYIKNNLPLFAKSFLAFRILYPDLKPNNRIWSFEDDSRISPELKDSSLPKFGYGKTANDYRFNIFYSSLARIAIDSRERSLVEYVENIDKGNKLYEDLISQKVKYDELSKEDKKVLDIFSSHLEVLWENTKQGSKENIDINGLSPQEKLFKFAEAFKPNYDSNGIRQGYDLKDRITRSFLYYAGYKSFDELKGHLDSIFVDAEKRNIETAREIQKGKKIKLETGDYLRGIGDFTALSGSLDSGNVCKDFLTMFGRGSTSDTTPLDVDITLVNEKENIYESIKGTPTGFGFGNVYIVVKKDNPKVNVTRDKDGNLTGNKFDPKKIDMFGSGVNGKGYETHWGALVGLALPTDIDYILYKEDRMINDAQPYLDGKVNYDAFNYARDPGRDRLEEIRAKEEDLKIIKNEIARKGIYIPVVDFSGDLIFTPEEYNEIRNKMQGLSRYGLSEYKISPNLVTPRILSIRDEYRKQQENDTVSKKREAIVNVVKEVLKNHGKTEEGLEVVEQIVGSLEEGKAEFIDTGSTGRGTNVPNDGDFDFMLKIDQNVAKNYGEFEKIKNEIREKYLSVNKRGDNSYNIRDKGVMLEGLDEPVDIDITFTIRTDKIQYSTDECVRDRLRNIKEQYPEQYDLVISNIIEAKKILKQAHAYKSRKADVPYNEKGGLGGVGVENWILQNGGSFIDAAKDFMSVAEGKEFDEFRKAYAVYDFGENHKAANGDFKHDDFVYNMTADGYNRMKVALKEYIKEYDEQQVISQQHQEENKQDIINLDGLTKEQLEMMKIGVEQIQNQEETQSRGM